MKTYETSREHLSNALNAIAYEDVITYSEANLSQWSNLIGITVDQVSTSASIGFKSDTFVTLINTIGIYWIGHGVNK